jgi:hypothetical protein
MNKIPLLTACAITFIFILASAQASFYATTNKLVYMASDRLNISGNVTSSMEPVNMTAVISNSTPITFYGMSSNSSSSNIFSISQPLIGLSSGLYTVNVSDGSGTISMGFELVSQITYLETHLIDAQDIKSVDTSTEVTTDNAMGGNFTELRDFSISGTVHYGNITLDRLYHFALVDQNYNLTYDTLYVDDDLVFELYNDTEDSGQNASSEKVLQKGQKLGDYMIGEIEYGTGDMIILGRPKGSSVYSTGAAVNFIVMAKDISKNFVSGETVMVRLLNSSKGVVDSLTNTTDSMGFFTGNFTAPSTTGTYAIDLNNSKGMEFFTVESFKLSGKVTDLSDNPAYSLAPNSAVRIYAYSRDSAGNAVNLTSGSVRITYPNGTSLTASPSQSETGVYYYDFSTGPSAGGFGAKVTGVYGGSTQDFITGFSVESVSMQLMAMNMNFIDQAEGSAGEVNAFAPNGNVTLMVFLSNISAGGMMAKDPEDMGLIDIDNSSTATDECGTLVSLVEMRDDMGTGLALPAYQAVNISRAIAMSGVSLGEQPPQSMMRQCVIIFQSPNRTGTFKVSAELNYNGEKKKSGVTFGIQRLYAMGASVDSKGDDYWFFAPNTTMKIKLKIRDLSTRQDLPAENITGAKIIEMYKEFPNFQDAFTAAFRVSANESVQNGTLVFNAPDAEGFFSLRFKFKAMVNGTEETGTGSAFFQLKKYMIWANPQCSQESMGPCISGLGKNVTLTVYAVDIDQGSMMSEMGKGTSSLTCTNCDGLVIDVGSLRNDQLMKEMTKNVDYYVVKGMLANATANLTIVPLTTKMQSGWYGLDLIVTDLANTNNTYFGWGGFEVRNFYVETMKIAANESGSLFASWDMAPVFEKGGSVSFAMVARDPSTGDMLSMSSASLESIKWMVGWPPSEIPTGSVSVSISNSTRVYAQWLPQEAVWYPYVVNITGLDKDGDFQADARVVTSKGSDIGSFFFSLSTYNINVYYRGMNEWKAIYSSSENLTVNFTALNFDDSSHNLSQEGSKLKVIYNQKTGTPIRLASATSCGSYYCSITTNLSSLQSGRYFAEFVINDSLGSEKIQNVEFMVQNLVFGIPSIEEAWVGYSETGAKDVDLNNDRDRCDNQLMFQGMWVEGQWHTQNFCIRSSGEWMQQPCGQENGTNITIQGNGSLLNIAGTNYTAGQNFSTTGSRNWTIVSMTSNQGTFRVNNTDGMCGEAYINCNQGGCQQIGYLMTPPGSHTTFYHGFLESLIGQNGNQFGALSLGETRPLYFYHNTTYVWISNTSSNMSLLGPARTIGETFNDSYGGQWKVTSISKTRIKITGLNVLAQTGAYINVSKSRSGIIKLGQIEEWRVGGWDTSTGNQRGLDLDGDGYTNGTAYIAIADNQVAGVYDSFFFFNHTGTRTFSTTISVSDTNISAKRFGLNDTLVVLSIDPRSTSVRLYSEKIGDWASLGDFRMDGNVAIPIIVKTPAGLAAEANVSVANIRVKGTGVNKIFSLGASVPNSTINGTGELLIENISQYNLGSGEYVFEIKVKQGSTEEMLEEWKWPRASPRTFLVDGYTGQAGYVSGFRPVALYRYDWETFGGEVPQIFTVNWTSAYKYYTAVMDIAVGPGGQGVVSNLAGCNFVKPPGAGDNDVNTTFRSNRLNNPQYYYYITAANESMVWVMTGSCNFSTGAAEYNATETPVIYVTKNQMNYTMRVLDADINNYSVVIGIKNSDFPGQQISPVRVSTWGPAESPVWFILGINVTGTIYNVILANDSREYPMCSVWNMQECAKRAWFTSNGNFSQAVPAYMGSNFTDQLYLSKIGPGPWEGVIVANFSQLGSLPIPSLDIRANDDTTSYYNMLEESGLNLDLNMDGDKADTFYVVTFDNLDDNQQSLTQVVVDDDFNITEEWWTETSNSSLKKDFYENESGTIGEKSSSLPNSIWSGNIWFGDQTNGNWEQQPQWDIKKYNGSDMLLLKDEWQVNLTGRNMTVLVRAYSFNQNAISGANVSVSAIKGNMPGFGFMKLNQGEHYNMVANMSVTNSDGYAILTIVPQGAWSGEYMVDIQTAYNGNSETTGKWFRVI